jgi:hypothetical protein
MIAMGMMPLGSMLLGAIADFIGVPVTLLGGGVGCLVALVAINLWAPTARSAT